MHLSQCLTLTQFLIPCTQVCREQYLLSKLKKKEKKKSLDFLPLFILIFLLLLEGMSPIQDIPTAQADRRGKMNTACQLQLQDHMSVQELSKMLHGNCTTGPGESTGIQASK